MQTLLISFAALLVVLSHLVPLHVQGQPIPWSPPGADIHSSGIGSTNNANNNNDHSSDDDESDDNGPVALQIGQHFTKYISSNDINSEIAPTVTMGGNRKEFMLRHENASYLSIHIKSMYINPFCRMRIYDMLGSEKDVLSGQNRRGLRSFWANHVPGDTMYIVLDCYEDDRGQAHYSSFFEVDEYVAGYTEEELLLNESGGSTRKLEQSNPTPSFESHINRDLTLCGTDDGRNAICYDSSYTTGYEKEYEASKAVARLVIGGARACTGWLVGDSNMLITNQHCIKTEADALNTDYEFMAQTTTCDDTTGACPLCGPSGTVYKATALLHVDESTDIAVVQLDGDPAQVYG